MAANSQLIITALKRRTINACVTASVRRIKIAMAPAFLHQTAFGLGYARLRA